MSVLATVSDLLQCNGTTVALDIETDGLEFFRNSMIGIGFYTPDHYGYVPTLTEPERQVVKDAVRILADNPSTLIIAHNLAFESLFLNLNPRKDPCRYLDTMVMAHIDDSRQRKGLEKVAERYLGIPEVKRVFKERGRNKPIHEWSLDIVSQYCFNDARIEYHLAEKLLAILKAQGLLPLLKKDMRYLGLIVDVTRRGMYLDQTFLDRAEKVIRQNVVIMEQELLGKVGKPINWKSTQQLSKALYDDMGIAKPLNPFLNEDGVDVNKGKSALYTRYNSACTSSFLLVEKAQHPLGPLVLALRESDKLAQIYCKQWRELADVDSIIHASFNLTGTRTGRLSSSKPNMQNLPAEIRARESKFELSGGTAIRPDEYNLRQAFRARPGHVYLSVDFKQQEGRLFALISQDKNMIQFVKDRKDIHQEVAFMVWGERDDVHREWAKTIAYGMIYGMSPGTLRHRLNKTPEEAMHITQAYYRQFPRIMPFMHEVIRDMHSKGYVKDWAGRIWREDDPAKQYKACNFLCQGGGADLLSVAALRCQDWLDTHKIGHLVSFIHDELLFEVEEQAIDEAAANLPKIMEVPDVFDAPFLTDAKIGPSYGQLEKVKPKTVVGATI